MQTKLSDQLYCAVSEERIRSTEPTFHEENFKWFFYWIQERYSIHKKKDILCEHPPWTDNEILKNYRFTNVRREHDRETKGLLQYISMNSALTLEEKVLNSILFRSWNKLSTFLQFGGPYPKSELNLGPEHFRPIIEKAIRDNPKTVWFTPAFNTAGLKQIWRFPEGIGYRDGFRKNVDAVSKDFNEENIPLRMFRMIKWVIDNDIVQKILNSKNQKECFDSINLIHGYGGFLSYQVFVDLTYIDDFLFSENEFTVAGPGCKRGIDRIVENRNGLSYEEVIFWIRDNQESLLTRFGIDINELMNDLPEYDRCLNVMSLENCFCEISKFLKGIYKEGRPKIKMNYSKNLPKENLLF